MKIGNFEVSPPKEAYRYWPTTQHALIETEEFVERLIFAKQELKEWEKVVLEQLEKYIAQRELIIPDSLMKLRFLYGQGWNIPQTFEALKYHLKWKQEWPPFKTLIPLLQPILSSGGLYIHGRDNRYRPAIIIRPNILSRFPYHLHLASAYFLLEFILETMLIPGQIENWVLIVDLKKFNGVDLNAHKRIIAELFTHYPCRIGKIYLLRGGKGLYGLSKLLPQNTMYKVNVVEKITDMLNDFHPQQLEIRYGGSVGNLKNFWPPTVPSTSFRGATDTMQDFLSPHSSYREYFPGATKIYSDLSSLKASQAGEKESFISNNDFKDEVWQRLELISASYSFLGLERLATQGDEEKNKEKRAKMISEELSLASTREPHRVIKDDSEIPFFCNICSSDCLLF